MPQRRLPFIAKNAGAINKHAIATANIACYYCMLGFMQTDAAAVLHIVNVHP